MDVKKIKLVCWFVLGRVLEILCTALCLSSYCHVLRGSPNTASCLASFRNDLEEQPGRRSRAPK